MPVCLAAVEPGGRQGGYERSLRPYTVALLSAVPVLDRQRRPRRERILLNCDVPNPLNPPPARRFHTRCWKAQDICRTVEPFLVERRQGTA